MKRKSLGDKINAWWMIFVIVGTIVGAAGTVFHSFLWQLTPIILAASGIGVVLPIQVNWSKRPWFIKFIAYFNNNLTPVELIDYACDRKYSMAKIYPDGKLHAPTFWVNDIGDSILLPDGRVDSSSETSYHYFWLPLRKSDRVEFLLKNDLPDFADLEKLPKDERDDVMYKIRKNRL